MARLKVSRNSSIFDARAHQALVVNGQKVFEIYHGVTSELEVPVGSYDLYVRSLCLTSNTVSLNIGADETVYLEAKSNYFQVVIIAVLLLATLLLQLTVQRLFAIQPLLYAGIACAWIGYFILMFTVWRHKLYRLVINQR